MTNVRRDQFAKLQADNEMLAEFAAFLQKLRWLPQDVGEGKLRWLSDLFQKERAK